MPRQTWYQKFVTAVRGIREGIRGQSSFLIHVPAAILVFLLAFLLECTLGEWELLILCVGLVFTAELLNSSLETLCRVLHPESHPQVGKALDIASGAVLVISLSSAIIGLQIFAPKLLVRISTIAH